MRVNHSASASFCCILSGRVTYISKWKTHCLYGWLPVSKQTVADDWRHYDLNWQKKKEVDTIWRKKLIIDARLVIINNIDPYYLRANSWSSKDAFLPMTLGRTNYLVYKCLCFRIIALKMSLYSLRGIRLLDSCEIIVTNKPMLLFLFHNMCF